jgi:hypothetical protein
MIARIDTDEVDDALDVELRSAGLKEEAVQAARRAFRIAVGRTVVFDAKRHTRLYGALMNLAVTTTDDERVRAFNLLREELGV